MSVVWHVSEGKRQLSQCLHLPFTLCLNQFTQFKILLQVEFEVDRESPFSLLYLKCIMTSKLR